MRNLTIKKKIILWFALVLLVIIAITEGITFVIASKLLDRNAEERLVNQVNMNAGEIEFFESLEGNEMEETDTYIEYAGGWLEVDDDFMAYQDGISTALLNSKGEMLYGRNLMDFPIEKEFAFKDAGIIDINGDKYYVYEKPLTYPEGLWLRGYISTNENTNLLYHFVRICIWLIPLLAALALVGGYLITRRSFRPIGRIADAAEEIGKSGDLSRRLDIGQGNDELHQLADTFNGMIGKLEKNFEAEKQFTSDVSHELRTPTAVIMAQSEYALELAETKEDYIESFEVIHRQSKLMNDMINQLLFFSRLELGTQKVNIEPTDISELTEHIAQEQALIGTNGITITTDIEKDVKKDVDVALYTRMLNNLIGNAYKYGKQNGHISVELEKIEPGDIPAEASADTFTHMLSITDDGIGMSEENLDKIWNRFFQVDTARTEGNEDSAGIGLGLSMVKQISAILGFEISVESSEGNGTSFHIYL